MKTASKFMNLPIWIYLLGWIFFVYFFFQILGYDSLNSNNILISGLRFIDFGVHEASHLIVFFLPHIWVAAAGTIGQICFPLLLLFATIKAKAYFASVFVSLWLMMTLHGVGRYMADAREQILPLMGPGENAQHDWTYIFGELGLLDKDQIIGGVVATTGTVIGVLGLGLGVYLIVMKIYLKHYQAH